MLKTRVWVAIIAGILILSAAAAGFLYFHRTPGTCAQILRNGEVIHEIDLSQVSEPFSLTLEDSTGSNTVSVEYGRISISEADCPDQVCVRHGWISTTGDPIVCLPHKLSIRIISMEDGTSTDTADTFDAVAR